MGEKTDNPEVTDDGKQESEGDKSVKTTLPTRPVAGQESGGKTYTEVELQDQVQKALKKPVGELEALKKQYGDMATKLRNADLVDAASKFGATYPSVVAQLKELVGKESQEDIEATMADLKKKYPQMFHPGPSDGGSGKAGGSGGNDLGDDMNARIRAAAGRG